MHESQTDNRNLLQPDVILPDQYFDTFRRQSIGKRGECQLMAAVLHDAIYCYQKNLFAKNNYGQRLFREAEEWMMSKQKETFSFEHICETLGLDPVCLRRGLRLWQERRRREESERRTQRQRLPQAPPQGSELAEEDAA